MDKERIKLIIRNIELLIDALKAEIYPESNTYKFDDIELTEIDKLEMIEDDLR